MNDFEAMMKQAMFNMENHMYNSLIADICKDADAEVYVQMQTLIAAFNRHGVSSRTVFEVLRDVSHKEGGTDE